MHPGYQIFCSYCRNDSACANILEDYLIEKGYTVFPKQLSLKPGEDFSWQSYLSNAKFFLVILSEAAVTDPVLLSQVLFARDQAIKIIPLVIDSCEIPLPIRNIQPLHFADRIISSGELSQVNEIINRILVTQSYNDGSPLRKTLPPRSEVQTAKPAKNVFKTILDSINPFKKTGSKSLEDISIGKKFPGNATSMAQRKPTDFRPGSSSSKPPDLRKTSKAKPAEQSPKGKILYDIPDKMTVNVQHKCIVRIGKNEAIVLDDDTFSPAIKIEDIPVSKVMEVDLLDISAPPRFAITKISSIEQLVEADSFSEWNFMVTPLSSGMFPLLLKASVIKVVDGKERRKELVFEKSVDISAEPVAGVKSEFKEMLTETSVKEMDPPVVFISYAHNDKVYFDIFLQYLKTQSNWTFWTDRNIEIGANWYESIQQSIKDADVAVLLISASFISSAFIKEHEFSKFSELKRQKPAFNFLPILLRDVDFTRWEELASMQLFVAYGDEYGVADKKGEMISFAKLCHFDNNGQLIPNDNLDTYFKNLVKKAEKGWLISAGKT